MRGGFCVVGGARAIFGTLVVTALGLIAQASEALAPEHGLLWNKTGLPAVFPLHVKTNAGQSYHLLLRDAENGDAALAAFIEGGTFFKVLVPPGHYELRFATGAVWQDEEQLFGIDATEFIALKEPLRFAVIKASIKAGHLVDLTEAGIVTIRDQYICQRVTLSKPPRPQAEFEDDGRHTTRLTDPGEIAGFPHRYSRDRLSAGTVRPSVPTDFAPYSSDPEYEVRQHPC